MSTSACGNCAHLSGWHCYLQGVDRGPLDKPCPGYEPVQIPTVKRVCNA